jgi:hypothetical protein
MYVTLLFGHSLVGPLAVGPYIRLVIFPRTPQFRAHSAQVIELDLLLPLPTILSSWHTFIRRPYSTTVVTLDNETITYWY